MTEWLQEHTGLAKDLHSVPTTKTGSSQLPVTLAPEVPTFPVCLSVTRPACEGSR